MVLSLRSRTTIFQARSTYPDIEQPNIQEVESDQSQNEDDEHRGRHLELHDRTSSFRVSLRTRMESGNDARKHKDEERNGQSRKRRIHCRQPRPCFLNVDRRSQCEICAIDQEENEDRRLPRIPVPKGAPVEFCPQRSGDRLMKSEYKS